MRQIFRIQFVLLSTCFLIGMTSELNAQQKAKTAQRQPQQTAEAVPTKKAPPKSDSPANQKAETADDVDDEEARLQRERMIKREKMLARLEIILARWETESAKIKTLHGKQSRSEFNHVFAVEKVSEGPFFLENPDKGRIDLKPIVIKPNMTSSRMTKGNAKEPAKPYTLETGKPERWICTGQAILVLNDDEKTYQKEEIPEEKRGKNIIDSPLPFVFGMKADEAKNRFQLSIVEETNETVMLLAIPKMEKDLDNYQKAAITLDKKTFVPTQVRLLDASKIEIVYTFRDVVVNDSDVKSRIGKLFNLDKDPYHPNLKGYGPVVTNEPQIQPANSKDSGGKNQMKPAGGAMPQNRDGSSAPKKPTQSASKGSATGTGKN